MPSDRERGAAMFIKSLRSPAVVAASPWLWRWRRVASVGALLVVFSSLVASFRAWETALPFTPATRFWGAVLLAALVLLGASAAVDRPRAVLRPRQAWMAALRRLPAAGAALLPLALLPWVRDTPFGAVACAGAAVALYVLTVGQPTLRSHAARRSAFAPWELVLLLVVVLLAIVFVQIGWRSPDNFQKDSAYYFGVAKHIAESGHYEEPIVWHFLRDPGQVPTAPFDYWGGLTSWLLVPVLAVSPTHEAANASMAVVSGLSLVLFWYLVVRAAPIRNPWIQLLALLSFALAPELALFRFDTESIPTYHLVLLGALVLAARGKPVAASLVAGLLAFARSDGFVACALLWGWALWASWRDGGRRHALQCLGAQLSVIAAFALHDLVLFGNATGARHVVWRLADELQLYRYQPTLIEPAALASKRLTAAFLSERIETLMPVLIRVLPGKLVWLLPAFVLGLGRVGREYRKGIGSLVWLLAFPGTFLVAALAPAVFVPWRSLAPLVPMLILAGAYALDVLVRATNQWSVHPLVRFAASSALIAFVGINVVGPLKLYGDRKVGQARGFQLALQKLDTLLEGRTVASSLPWYVMANTSSPAVSIPIDGEPAIASVLERYDVRWLVLPKKIEHLEKSTKAINRVLSRPRTTIGPFDVALEKRLGELSVYRVERRAAGP